jgi:hypothetical protein
MSGEGTAPAREPVRWHKSRVRCVCGFTWISIHQGNPQDVECLLCMMRVAELVSYIGFSDISAQHCQDTVGGNSGGNAQAY